MPSLDIQKSRWRFHTVLAEASNEIVVLTCVTSTMFIRLTIPGIAFAFLLGLINSSSYAQSALPRKSTDMKNDTLRGVVEPLRNTEVASTEVGIVRKIMVKAGDIVKPQQILATLDDEQQRLRLEGAEIEWQAHGSVETAEREVEFNYKKYLIATELAKKNRVSPLELDRDTLEWKIATAKLTAQKEAKDLSYSKWKEAREALARRAIYAPHEGVVVEVVRDEGEYLAANQPSIVRLWDISKLRARFLLSDEVASRYRELKVAMVKLSNGAVIAAEIEFIAPVASVDATEMTVLLDNPNREIRSSSCDLIRP